MALLFIDGWDYYNTADLPKKWDSLIKDFDNNTPDLSAETGRYTGQAVHLGPHGISGLTKNFATQTDFYVGFALNFSNAVNYGRILGFPGPSGQSQVDLTLNAGTLTIGNQFFFVSSVTAITIDVWNYIEVKVTGLTGSPTCAAGSIKVRINGVEVISVPANQRTSGDITAGSLAMSRIILGGGTGTTDANDVYVDDLYVCNGSGSANNTFLGDCRIELLKPTADGANKQFTPDTGTDNFARIDEAFEDGDTSYVSSNTVTDTDTYTFGDLSTDFATIKAIQVNIVARKDDIGSRLIASAIKSGSTTYDHGIENPFGLGDSYSQQSDVWDTDPNGNIPWTSTTVNAMEVGVKLIA